MVLRSLLVIPVLSGRAACMTTCMNIRGLHWLLTFGKHLTASSSVASALAACISVVMGS